jgi:hypothetical protein
MGRRGRAAVLERYRWEDQGARLAALYARLFASDPTGLPVGVTEARPATG